MHELQKMAKRIKRNQQARERYYMKRYGNLDRMELKDIADQEKIDDESAALEEQHKFEVEHEFDTIKQCWDEKTCYPSLSKEWTKENPSLGQCAVTALLIQDLIGGQIYCNKSKHHYYNHEPAYRGLIDLTEDQFDSPVKHDYCNKTSREYLLCSDGAKEAKTLERYQLLKERYIRAGGWGEIT